MSIICLTLLFQVHHSIQDVSQSLLVMKAQVLPCTEMTYPLNWNERVHKNRAWTSSAKQNLLCNLVHWQLSCTGSECVWIRLDMSSRHNVTSCAHIDTLTCSWQEYCVKGMTQGLVRKRSLLHNHNPYEKLGAGSCSCCSCLSIAVRCLSSACLPSHCTGNLHSKIC